MIIRGELARADDRVLTKLQFVDASGQTYSTSYEVLEREQRTAFADLAEAERAFGGGGRGLAFFRLVRS